MKTGLTSILVVEPSLLGPSSSPGGFGELSSARVSADQPHTDLPGVSLGHCCMPYGRGAVCAIWGMATETDRSAAALDHPAGLTRRTVSGRLPSAIGRPLGRPPHGPHTAVRAPFSGSPRRVTPTAQPQARRIFGLLPAGVLWVPSTPRGSLRNACSSVTRCILRGRGAPTGEDCGGRRRACARSPRARSGAPAVVAGVAPVAQSVTARAVAGGPQRRRVCWTRSTMPNRCPLISTPAATSSPTIPPQVAGFAVAFVTDSPDDDAALSAGRALRGRAGPPPSARRSARRVQPDRRVHAGAGRRHRRAAHRAPRGRRLRPRLLFRPCRAGG